MADRIKLALAGLAIVAGLVGFYALANQPLVLRVLSVIGGVAAAAVVGWFTEPGRQFVVFARESVAEAKRVVWPTRKEAMQTTGVVFVFVVLMALFIFVVDVSLSAIVRMLMERGS
ncbi:MAG: preprotein translocase subunit SecE [Burkholderiales bacterium]|jgi:preprotein translocase subunit SecE|nr:preprotein translocase subunit SecE [Burkholderiales bacterium]